MIHPNIVKNNETKWVFSCKRYKWLPGTSINIPVLVPKTRKDNTSIVKKNQSDKIIENNSEEINKNDKEWNN